MKGVIFVELLASAEEAFGEDSVNLVSEGADLPSGGAYTAVGNYPCDAGMGLLRGLSTHCGIDPAKLQRRFGHWMTDSFARRYPSFFEDKSGCRGMLPAIEGEIHLEVSQAPSRCRTSHLLRQPAGIKPDGPDQKFAATACWFLRGADRRLRRALWRRRSHRAHGPRRSCDDRRGLDDQNGAIGVTADAGDKPVARARNECERRARLEARKRAAGIERQGSSGCPASQDAPRTLSS